MRTEVKTVHENAKQAMDKGMIEWMKEKEKSKHIIWRHNGYSLMRCYIMLSGRQAPTFWKNLLPPSGDRNELTKEKTEWNKRKGDLQDWSYPSFLHIIFFPTPFFLCFCSLSLWQTFQGNDSKWLAHSPIFPNHPFCLLRTNFPLVPMQKCRTQQEDDFLHLWLTYKEETSEMLHLEHSFVWYWNSDTLESRSEYLENSKM